MIEKIERNAFGHFKYLPQMAGYPVHESEILTIINSGLGSSMFNIVCNTHLERWAKQRQDTDFFNNGFKEKEAFSIWNILSPGLYADAHMASYRYGEAFIKQMVLDLIERYKGQPFAWWVGPSCDPDWLGPVLKEAGLEKLTNEYAMICDLADFNEEPSKTILNIKRVSNPQNMEDFIQVLEPYDITARAFYESVSMPMLDGQEQLFVGYENGVPVEIGLLFSHEDTAGIFSLLTREDKRGLGYGTHMMTYLMQKAKDSGAKYATLSASSDSGFRIYERLGFKVQGEFECFEWAGSS